MASGTFLSISLLLSFLLTVNCQDCASNINCGDCIATIGCQWCATLNFENDRCSTNHTSATCNDIQTSTGTTAVKGFSGSGNPVNVTNVTLSLGVGMPNSFRVTVTPLRNLPLDLYVLIDLSFSMGEELRELISVAGEIANRIASVTNNIRIGFGSFNDKVTRPYTYFFEDSTCSSPFCEPNYAFRHQITLTDDIPSYSSRISGVTTTRNVDQPENGLEGLAQVVACEDIIGWRSRQATGDDRGLTRIVLFMTDDAFHYSGEGQLAGILKPYEGECLLEPAADGQSTVEFTRWREVDYPSVGQVVQMLQENEVAVIFAIEQTRLETYRNLASLINLHYRASVSELVENGSSILNLIDQEYRNILQSVRLVPDESEELQIVIRPNCPTGTTEVSGGCDNVELEQAVEFEVSVTLNSCDNFQNSSALRSHKVVSPGFSDFTIFYRGECTCACEANAMNQVARCNNQGNFVCGVCECNDGWCGEFCELQIGTACECEDLTDTCSRDINGTLCYGQGACCNGMCVCNTNENGNVYRHSGTTQDCACPPAEEVCVNPNNPSSMCGNGTCGCNGCVCENRFFGSYCQSRDVNTCGDTRDLQCLQACVDSQFDQTTCRSCEATRPILTIDTPPASQNLITFLETEASRQLGGSDVYEYVVDCTETIGVCTYDYYLLRGPEMYTIILQQTPLMCTSTQALTLPFPAWVFIFIVIGILLILGVIVFVLIRVIISILDYMEVKKWERETKDADFSKNQNPLYQSPEMKYENVAYGRE